MLNDYIDTTDLHGDITILRPLHLYSNLGTYTT